MIGFVLESLDDPLFYLGVAAVLGATLVPFLILRHQKLFFEMVCEAKLLRPKDEASEQMMREHDAVWGDDEAETMLFVMDLHNAPGGLAGVGGVDIAPAQQPHEISFGFGEGARLLEAGVLEGPRG